MMNQIHHWSNPAQHLFSLRLDEDGQHATTTAAGKEDDQRGAGCGVADSDDSNSETPSTAASGSQNHQPSKKSQAKKKMLAVLSALAFERRIPSRQRRGSNAGGSDDDEQQDDVLDESETNRDEPQIEPRLIAEEEFVDTEATGGWEGCRRASELSNRNNNKVSVMPVVPPSSLMNNSRRRKYSQQQQERPKSPVRVAQNMLHGTLDPDGGVEVVFYDCMQFGDKSATEFEVDFTRESVVLSSIRSTRKLSTPRRGAASASGGGDGRGRHGHGGHGRGRSPTNAPTVSSLSFGDAVTKGGGGMPQPNSPGAASAYSSSSPNVGGSCGFHSESVEISHQQHQEQRQKYSFLSPSSSTASRDDGNRDPQRQNQYPSPQSRSAESPSSSSSSGSSYVDPNLPPPPPPPPAELPLRFLRAGKGDPVEGLRRYEATLKWRADERIDTILREGSPHFDLIKEHYPHFCFGRGKLGEPCYYEQPPMTNLKALRDGGVNLEMLLRHYIQVTEFQWQFLVRDDLQRSIYIIDLKGMRFSDFVGEVVDFVKQASYLSAQHYPERAGYVFVINVPAWFKVVWNVIRPIVDESTLDKIYILKANEITSSLMERIDVENIPEEYGGQGPPLAESSEEKLLADLVRHNNHLESGKPCMYGGLSGNQPCKFCSWIPPRSY